MIQSNYLNTSFTIKSARSEHCEQCKHYKQTHTYLHYLQDKRLKVHIMHSQKLTAADTACKSTMNILLSNSISH